MRFCFYHEYLPTARMRGLPRREARSFFCARILDNTGKLSTYYRAKMRVFSERSAGRLTGRERGGARSFFIQRSFSPQDKTVRYSSQCRKQNRRFFPRKMFDNIGKASTNYRAKMRVFSERSAGYLTGREREREREREARSFFNQRSFSPQNKNGKALL